MDSTTIELSDHLESHNYQNHDRVSLVSSFGTEEENMLRSHEEVPLRERSPSYILSQQSPGIDFNEQFELRPLTPSQSQSSTPIIKSNTTQQQRHPGKSKEWVPFMLRKGPALFLLFACWVMVVLLEYLSVAAHKQQGFYIANKTTVRLARYCPTIAVIILGFGWKSLIKDVKIIAPYAAMSERWELSYKSLLLDYLDPLDIVSVWKSARNQHLAMFVVLIGGLLSGVLVPLANTLTFTNLSSPVEQSASLSKISQFSFNNTLATPNGTLYIPWDYQGQKPYAAVVSARQPNGANAPWTTDDFAFESFDTVQWSKTNASISTSVQAFNAPFDCTKIGYDTNSVAIEDDLTKANCSSSLVVSPHTHSNSPGGDMGWLNITNCSPNGTDLRMVVTVVSNALSINNRQTISLLCRPKYFLHQIDIRVNGSTGGILSLDLKNDTPQSIDIGAGLPAIITYLNFPLDPASQSAYLGTRNEGPSPSFMIPQATFYNVTQYAQSYAGLDVFFRQLLTNGRNASDYTDDPVLLNNEVVGLANMLLTQIVSSFSRTPVNNLTNGSVVIYQPRLLVREASLRAMQVILALMGLVSVICCTLLRPRSRLIEDPTSIAAVSVLLAGSEDGVRKKLREVASSDSAIMNATLGGWRWRLSGLQGSRPTIEATDAPLGSESKERRKFQPGRVFPTSKAYKHVPQKRIATPKEHQPLPFKFFSRLFMGFLFVAVIIALAVLLRFSNLNDGFPTATSISSAAWSFIPTSILVILGYCLSSVDSVLTRFAPYIALRKTSGARSMLFSPNSSALTMPFRALLIFGSASLAISSFTTLFYPAVNIVAAGLYSPVGSTQTKNVQMMVDTTLMDNFEDMYSQFPEVSSGDMAAMIARGSQFAEWTMIPSFGVPQRPGVLQNLAFSNLTGLQNDFEKTSSLEDRLAVRLTAIEVNVSCDYFGIEHFQPFVANFGSGNYVFSMQCVTESCNNTIGMGELVTKQLTSNTSISPSEYYLGRATIPGLGELGLNSSFDVSYNVVLSNFSNFMVPFINLTSIEGGNDAIVKPGMFNFSSFPSMVAVSCKKSFWEVDVNTIITRSVKSNLNSTITQPWAVSEYENSSIAYKRQYNNTMPLWALPVPNTANQYSGDIDGTLDSTELWPSRGMSTNFFELLAAYQQYSAGDLNAIFAPNQLAVAAEAMFTAYCVQMLTELRLYTSNASTTSPRLLSGTITTPLIRIKQDSAATIAILVLLGLMFLGLLWIFIRFPKESVLPKPPTSIAAQMSMVAGSSFVQDLRDQGVQSVKGTDIWERRFKLGEWPGEENGNSRRWGIDTTPCRE